jgi:hypothetical protein
MSLIDNYMDELAAALHERGRNRRRMLDECREHLVDAAAERGEVPAVRAFGPAVAIAAELDAESATRRSLRATLLTGAGVIVTGASTLYLINAAQPGVSAPTAWAIVFFIAAQLSATAVALACVQALAQRHATAAAADLSLLARRNVTALGAAGVTMFAAGAALPGHGSPVVLLAGPVLACIAFIAVLRARGLTRRLAGAREPTTRPPLDDLGRVLQTRRLPRPQAAGLLATITALAAAAAFARDTAEHATAGGAAVTAGIEAIAVVLCFLAFGHTLGLWGGRAESGPALSLRAKR